MTTPEPDAKICSKCGLRPRAPGQRRCLECHAEYMRNWRLQQTTIRMWPDNYEYLRRRSFDERASMSKLINEAIDQQRRRHERRQDDSEVSRETKHG